MKSQKNTPCRETWGNLVHMKIRTQFSTTPHNFGSTLGFPWVLPLQTASIHPIKPEGWKKDCAQCGDKFVLPWVASFIRDGREEICPPCYISNLEGLH